MNGVRPGAVTAAGVLLIIGGVLGILAGLFLLFAIAGVFGLLGVVVIVIGALELYAGRRVLGLKENGRQIGIVLAAISGVLNLLSIGRAPGSSIISLAIDLFILWALTQNAAYFTP